MASKLELEPVSLTAFGDTPLGAVDLLGRNKVVSAGLANASADQVKEAANSAFARIDRNAFKFKSLSSWSYNIAVGCRHACRFCYVPDSQQTSPGKEKENTGPLAKSLREYGIVDPDLDWGKYVLLRPWHEDEFLASLRSAEKIPKEKLNRDGNRAIILCSTTDPYQTLRIVGNPQKQNLLNAHARFLVRRALELILERSTLNVRILTRSPLAKQDFDLYKQFGNRILFGMSLPTLREDLLKVYEPHAPGAKSRLATLKSAAEANIPLYVAIAPTYPDLEDEDIRDVLKAVKPFRPLTVFHEPINIRAENVERIAEHARELGVAVRTDVFANPTAWRRYAVDQLRTVQRIAGEEDTADHLHLWPDRTLRTRGRFLDARKLAFAEASRGRRETTYEREQRRLGDEAAFQQYSQWLAHWHNRVSEWPGKP